MSARTLVASAGVAQQRPAFEDSTVVTRGECSSFVDLARRMSITPDDAIRQFIDLNRRHRTGRARRP